MKDARKLLALFTFLLLIPTFAAAEKARDYQNDTVLDFNRPHYLAALIGIANTNGTVSDNGNYGGNRGSEVNGLNQTETVAFWAGFIASIAGIVLSIIAIIFSVLVDHRSRRITDHTIQSLQKIESAVERLSSDTRELIKAGWDKMLGSVDKPLASEVSSPSDKEMAAGIAAEARSELQALSTQAARSEKALSPKSDDLEKFLKGLEASVLARTAKVRRRSLDGLIELIGELSDEAHAILKAISRHHLSQKEYKQLSSGQFGPALGITRARPTRSSRSRNQIRRGTLLLAAGRNCQASTCSAPVCSESTRKGARSGQKGACIDRIPKSPSCR